MPGRSGEPDRPRISVVVPARDAAATLAETLDAIRGQSIDDWEAVVVDDGSLDDTLEIARRREREDPRFRAIHRPVAGGIGAGRNSGVEVARGELFLFLDADDWIASDHLEGLAGALAQRPEAAVAYSRFRYVMPDGATLAGRAHDLAGDLFAELSRGNLFPVHCALVRAEPLRRAGGWDESLEACEDWEFWLRMARGGGLFVPVSAESAFYRVRPGSTSSDGRRLLRAGLRVLLGAREPEPRLPGDAGNRRAAAHPAQPYHFLTWCAGLEIGGGRDPVALLAELPDGELRLEAIWVARSLARSVLLGAARDGSAWDELWSDAEPRLTSFLVALGRKLGDPGLAGRTREALPAAIAREREASA